MMTVTRTLTTLLAVSVLTAVAAPAEEEIGPTGFGFRGDGSGVFPDAKPPTRWSDTENIVWKAKLPNWGYSCPVPLVDQQGKGKVFFLTEPFPPHYWPQLNCFDAATGKHLWNVDVNPLDAFPDLGKAEREKLTGHIKWVHDGFRAVYRIASRLYETGGVKSDDPRMVAVNEELAAYGVRVNGYRPGYGLLRAMKYTDGRRREADHALGRRGIKAETTWARFGWARCGAAFPTPVTDGTRLYVTTVHGTVACFDLDGKLVWSRYSGFKLPKHSGHLPSPRLWNDQLITYFEKYDCIGWDARTGRESWRAKVPPFGRKRRPMGLQGFRGSRPGGSPVVMTLGETPVVIISTGYVIRLEDGRVYDANIPPHLATVAVDDEGDRIYSRGSLDGKADVWGVHLAIRGDVLQVEKLFVRTWGGASSPVFADGRLFCSGRRGHQLDPRTGGFLGVDESVTDPRKPRATAPQTRHVLLAAGGHVYGLRQVGGYEKYTGKIKKPTDAPRGVCQVFTYDGKKVAENTLSAGPWDEESTARWREQGFGQKNFSYSCSFNIAGNRIYLCSQDFLYCIGK